MESPLTWSQNLSDLRDGCWKSLESKLREHPGNSVGIAETSMTLMPEASMAEASMTLMPETSMAETSMAEASTPEASMALICAFCLCGSSVFFCKWVSQKCAPPGCVTRYACLPSWEVLRSRTQPCLCYRPVHVNPDTASRQTRSYLGSCTPRPGTKVSLKEWPCFLV